MCPEPEEVLPVPFALLKLYDLQAQANFLNEGRPVESGPHHLSQPRQGHRR